MERQRARYHADIEEARRSQRDRIAELRVRALEHYGGSPPRGACCGEQNTGLLAIDHIDGSGGQHRRQDPSAKDLARWLSKSGYPPGFRVLCFSCNIARHMRGYDGRCPHEVERAVLALFRDPHVRLISVAIA
jgi:hypothetical protein